MFASVKLLYSGIPLLFAICLALLPIISASEVAETENAPVKTDLSTSATSAQLFNLGSLFGQNPNYGYGNGYYPSSGGYRPGSYYPYKYNSYGSNSFYPSTGGYYPTSSGWAGSNYPNYGYGYGSSGGYYPSSYGYGNTAGGGYYPNGGGTNILGGTGGYGGYGGYGGNGGLRQYDGYWNPQYSGQRNRGYGYYADSDRYGLPNDYERRWNDRRRGGVIGNVADDDVDTYRDRDRVYGAYRGYD